MDDESYRASLEERIRKRAKSLGVLATTVRRQETLKLFLDRLANQSDAWCLKGALLLEARLAKRNPVLASRTKDADLGAQEPLEELLVAIRRACVYSEGDRFTFIAAGPTTGHGADCCVRIDVYLAGRLWDRLKLDLSHDEYIQTGDVEPHDLGVDLDDNRLAKINAQPLAYALADKLDAYTKRPEALSSREHNLPDMVALAELAAKQGLSVGRLRKALRYVFADRDVPGKLPKPPSHWPNELSHRATGGLITKEEAYGLAARFWDPVLTGKLARAAVWRQGRWLAASADA